jgi:hypothetical protein
LAPEWRKLEQSISGSGIRPASLNCEENPETCRTQNIRGYPTIRLYINDQAVEYTSPDREFPALKTWLSEKYAEKTGQTLNFQPQISEDAQETMFRSTKQLKFDFRFAVRFGSPSGFRSSSSL